MIRSPPLTPPLCLGACEPVLSLAWGVSPELRTVLRARVSDSFVLRPLGGGLDGVIDSKGAHVELIVERPAALDVHKAQVTACVRVSDGHGQRREHIAEFAT